ncbi:NUDIX hydrolase [Neorhizobium alkalisoli]|uniref:NUDIX hydrolase n=1 Tax=Neorhizobium alkalisoli TaxID=528178 RepID=UPI000CF98FB8|nr:NUDIX hydrolase [Neorhizobium alkalisoli]
MKGKKKNITARISSDSQSSPISTGQDVQQAAAICYRCNGNGKLQVLLVVSGRNGRWGVPKGHLDPGESSHAAAQRESYEEAGVLGPVEPDMFGTFAYEKDSSPNRYHVVVQLLEESEIATRFPEKATRKQRWHPQEAAIRAAAQPGLRMLLSKLQTRAL